MIFNTRQVIFLSKYFIHNKNEVDFVFVVAHILLSKSIELLLQQFFNGFPLCNNTELKSLALS